VKVRTIIAVIIGISLVSCSEEETNIKDRNKMILKEVEPLPKEVNPFLGCWEDVSDSLPVYWCFDSININRFGYIHPYSFSNDSIKISEIDFRFKLSDSILNLINLSDSSESVLKRSELTQSPDVF
jgi:hypothetical protein